MMEMNIFDLVYMVLKALGTAGLKALEAAEKFQFVVINEAAQSVEIEICL
jgi:hypothetical protein